MTESKESLIEGLNKDLSHEYQAVIMYNTFASSVLGIYRKELETFFRSEVPDELRHAQFLSDKIVALGGTPATKPAPVPEASDVEAMLEATRDAETDTIARYGRRREQAEAYGDIGLVNDLEELISDETKHKEDTEKMLRGSWTGK